MELKMNRDRHEHNHNHNHEETIELSLHEKLKTLLKHWIDHNLSHKENYDSWAEKAEKEGLKEIASCLEQAGELSDKANILFKKALKELS